MKKRHERSEIFFLWTYQFNGKCNEKDKTPRPQRKAWPTDDLINSIIKLFEEKGQTQLSRNRLWKSHAEHTKNEPLEKEPRACKPVYITPAKVREVILKDANDGTVINSGPPSLYADGRWRYYFSDYGYKFCKRGNLTILEGGKKVGIVNPAFREGVFR